MTMGSQSLTSADAANLQPAVQEPPTRRTRLWELDHRFHCLVIGTCLTMDELRRLARKADITVGAKMSDYELHHSFVQVVDNAVFAARATHKWLDRKFAAAIKRFSACRDAGALGSLWDQATAQGEVASAFWALITHPLTDAALQQRVYGEVHMLSHLAGHSNRSTQQQLVVVKRRVAELEEAQAWTAEASRLRIKDLEQRAEALAERAQRVDVLERELAVTQARLAALENGEALAQLRAERDALVQKLAQVLQRAENAERRLREWAPLARSNTSATRPPAAPIPVLTGEASSDDHGERCPPRCDAVEAGDCPGPNLCGRRVLYVGGRNRQVAHFRDLVARRNGELLHHDGGLSESTARLTAMIHSADAVLCPVDCVSHDACLRIKRLCKRAAKRFVPLRSASLSAFIVGLQEVAA
jgi:hypothetical protein